MGAFSLGGAGFVSLCPVCPRPLLGGAAAAIGLRFRVYHDVGGLRAGKLQRKIQRLRAETAVGGGVPAREVSSVKVY